VQVVEARRSYKSNGAHEKLVGRQSAASKGVNTEAEKTTALEAVTRQRQVKKQLNENN
jgi:hypothetical protein